MEFLFSKDVREIIAKLRAEGRLNETVLKNLKGYFFVEACKGGIISLWPLFLLLLGLSWVWSFLLIVSFLVIFLLEILYRAKRTPQKFVPLFYRGKMVDGVVSKCARSSKYFAPTTGWSIYYTYTVNNSTYDGKIVGVPIQFFAKESRPDEKIKVLYDLENPSSSIPVVQSLRQYFDFKKENT
ncbi:MAG: hypothetical protein EA357_05980 [Micavibrio sp.]|nr:MAG: hypothetical protein EA357_05980 [Micavibrio sp.]